MYSKFPLPSGRTNGETVASVARPPQLERERRGEGGGVADDGASAPLFAGDMWGKGQTVRGGGFAALVQFFGEIFYAYFPFDSMQTLWALGLNINCKLPFLSNRFLCQTVTGKMGKMFHLPFLLRESGSI